MKIITQITGDSQYIKLTDSLGNYKQIKKANVEIFVDTVNSLIYLYDMSGSSKFNLSLPGSENSFKLDYTKITNPVTANVEALATAIMAIVNDIPGGDLTASTSLLSTIPYSQADEIELAAANADRIGVIVYNNTDIDLYVKLGDACNTGTNNSFILSPGGSYESYKWTGIITGAQAAGGAGSIQVTELLA